MSDILKGNFTVKNKIDLNEIKKDESTSSEIVGQDRKRELLASLGGSMVYVEKETLSWDGDDAK